MRILLLWPFRDDTSLTFPPRPFSTQERLNTSFSPTVVFPKSLRRS